MCDSLFGKDMSVKTKFEFENQVTYYKGTMVGHNIPPSPYTYGLY